MDAKYEPGTWVRYRTPKNERYVIILRPLFNEDGSVSYVVNNHNSEERFGTINEEDIIEEIDMHDKG